MKVVVPAAIEEVIAKFNVAEDIFDEDAVKQALVAARQSLVNPGDAENLGAWAELLAFALVGTRHHSSPWNTYFGPLASGRKADGSAFYSPDIAGTEPEVIPHWIERAKNVTHPVLKARYADLAWDMSRAIAQINPDPEMARTAIDAYLASIAGKLRGDVHEEFESALRALDLAAMIRDTGRTDSARAALLALHGSVVAAGEGLWWIAFDRLIDDKRVGMTDTEKERLIADLEAVVTRRSTESDPKVFDPHATQDAATRLIACYTKLKRWDDIARLNQRVAQSFEHAASLADPMLAASFLQTAVTAYRDARLPEDSRRARVVMEEKIAASHAQMQSHTFEMPITKDDMERFLDAVVVKDGGATFARIASEFVHRRSTLEGQVEKQMKNSPLTAMVSQVIMAQRHVAAKVGAVEDDPFGRVIQRAAQSMTFNDIWLLNALDRAIEVHDLTPHHFVSWVARTGLFKDFELLLEGLTAWFQQDFVKTVHVLIPQVEAGLRAIVEKLGKPTTKAHPKIQGTSVAISMGDILYSREVIDALGEDITLYLLTLYTDPRGFNLRNYTAHGLMSPNEMNAGTAARLIHSLLVLGIWDQLAEARKKKPSNDQ